MQKNRYSLSIMVFEKQLHEMLSLKMKATLLMIWMKLSVELTIPVAVEVYSSVYDTDFAFGS